MITLSTISSEASTTSSGSGGADLMFYVILIALLAVVVFVMKTIFARRAARKVAGATGDAVASIAIRIAPAPPFPDDVARVRALLGETSPAPQITRYSVPVITTDAQSLRIRDAKIGEIACIPLSAIAAIDARDASIKPKGTFVAQTYPSLWITVATASEQLSVALTPVTGAYGKVRPADVEALAADLRALLPATAQ
jgi:hypothetical protein